MKGCKNPPASVHSNCSSCGERLCRGENFGLSTFKRTVDLPDSSRGAVLNEGTPSGFARGSCQVVDWVLLDDEIAFGSLVFARMPFVENSVSDDAACSVSCVASAVLPSQHSGACDR